MSVETRDINGLICRVVDPHEFYDILNNKEERIVYMCTDMGYKTYICAIVRDTPFLYEYEIITWEYSSHIPNRINRETFESDYKIYLRRKKILKIKEKI